MIKFHQYLESLENNVINKINSLIEKTKQLPDQDIDSDLWQVKNKKKICLSFFYDVKNRLPDPELEERLNAFDLNGNYLDVYHALDAPKSPVRVGKSLSKSYN